MEREGSGFDLMYDRLLTSGRSAPTVTEGVDSVHVVVPRRVLHPGVIRLVAEADRQYQLTQRERIALGLLGQSEGMSANQLAGALELPEPRELRPWTARLVELGLVRTTGRTRGTRYYVDPTLLREAGLDEKTTLARIGCARSSSRMSAAIPGPRRPRYTGGVGPEIPDRTFRRALNELRRDGQIRAVGERRWRRYHPVEAIGHDEPDGR